MPKFASVIHEMDTLGFFVKLLKQTYNGCIWISPDAFFVYIRDNPASGAWIEDYYPMKRNLPRKA